ncbi:hypothetical protein COB52_01785 [Candidatus Kaiserbacteria bacterium]|nr:MAG: hypothetical protein COB52_01785 [Candidatus Kaiserbacteria bacterium]
MVQIQTKIKSNTFFISAAIFIILGFLLFANVIKVDSVLLKEAESILKICEDEDHKPSCYDEEIPKVMDRGFSFEEAFLITDLIQQQDDSYWYCHVLGHNLSAKETAKDVSRWTEVVARSPRGMCSNGSLHGAFQERFRGSAISEKEMEDLIPEIKEICKKSKNNRDFTRLEQASCYHALGHLTMYITNADVDRSLYVCDSVLVGEEKDFRSLCYDGLFMQIFQTLGPEDVALVQDIAPTTKEEAIKYCSRFSGAPRTSCYIETHPLFKSDLAGELGAIEGFCDKDFSNQDRTRCLNGIFYIAAALIDFDVNKVREICSYVSDPVKAQCYANSASRFLEVDYKLAEKAVEICEISDSEEVSKLCYQELLFYSSYNYTFGSSEHGDFCGILPLKWKTKCLDSSETHIIPFYNL